MIGYGYANNRPVSVTVNGVSVLSSVTYVPFGPNGGWVWGNSVSGATNTHTRAFDKDYRPTRVTSDRPTSGTQPSFDRQIGWDRQSRVESMTDLASSALNATYGFNDLDHLTSATQGAASWGYTFNGIGDRATASVGASTPTGDQTWVYGGNNRPTQAGSTFFLINALGQRVKKTTGSHAIRFVYDEAGRLWGEYAASGALIQETVWLDDLPVATLRPNGSGGTDIYYVHPDHLGTPRAVTRPSDNQFVWKWDNTEPFGYSAPNENPAGVGTFAFNLRFPGQYFDSETGLSYNYFRDYDPSIGRYIESDPIGLKGGLNTFGYVGGSPLNFADPLGLAKFCCRPLDGPFRITGKRHCFAVGNDGTSHSLFPGVRDNVVVGIGISGGDNKDSADAPGTLCFDCPNPFCSPGEQDRCMEKTRENYPVGMYGLWTKNSNTFGGTVARGCCKGGVPPGVGNAPGIGDSPPSPLPPAPPIAPSGG